ncbi:DUF3623 family protein, partial [Rhodocyclus tenuis]
ALVSTLLVLAILEHWFMVVPLNGAKLWLWSLQPERRSRVAGEDCTPPANRLSAEVSTLPRRRPRRELH